MAIWIDVRRLNGATLEYGGRDVNVIYRCSNISILVKLVHRTCLDTMIEKGRRDAVASD
jgi:hypothetical protein